MWLPKVLFWRGNRGSMGLGGRKVGGDRNERRENCDWDVLYGGKVRCILITSAW